MMPTPHKISEAIAHIGHIDPTPLFGKVVEAIGLTVEATGPSMRIGDLCYVQPRDTLQRIPMEVVGFRGDRVQLMALGKMGGIAPGSLLIPTHSPQNVRVGEELLGRVVGSLGEPLDGGPVPACTHVVPVLGRPPSPLERRRILQPIATGIRAIDACITCGKGQRVGIMSGSGIGKSKMLGMIARNTNADVNVLALIGERGREVLEFIEQDLGPQGLKRSVVVAVTADQPALLRIRGAHMATTIAEWFRDQGGDVMLLMDSITRFAMAQREVGLAVGEPPTTKGYPPSVYGLMAQLLERAGTSPRGTITGMYTVLVEADDLNDPIADGVRSILDGHVVLSRDLASRNHYPAVDVLESISRCMIDVAPPRHQELAARIRKILATYRDAADLVNIGAYAPGSNPEIDEALKLMPRIRQFLQQGLYESCEFANVVEAMRRTLEG